jgi:hypothetical protein
MLLSMGRIQTAEEWGQRAKIAVPSRDIELANMPPELKLIASIKRI